jgi:hypothetical protein
MSLPFRAWRMGYIFKCVGKIRGFGVRPEFLVNTIAPYKKGI